MATLRDNLMTCKKGARISIGGDDQVVTGTATLHPMGRKTRTSPYTVIPNKREIRLVWTKTHLILRGPRMEQGEECWMVLERADFATIDLAELSEEAGVFGGEKQQAQKTVSYSYDRVKYWFTDVGTMGGETPDVNEGNVVSGPVCLRFYHLVTDHEDDNAAHILYVGPSTHESEFSGGDAWDTLWTNGRVIQPEDLIKM